ncbi:MAG: glycosyltransferase family 2 protein [Oligoflexia bacterium]|nr:glycosyltransferase family 2 protein [Oligoflexia bacterium]
MNVNTYDTYISTMNTNIEISPKSLLPLLSVVIPAFNRSQLLLKTLLSFAEQTLSRELFEIIVVDDGSSENLKVIVDEASSITSISIRYFYQTNQGPGAARNRGAQEAYGSFIALIDSDVIPSKDWLRNGLNEFKSSPHSVAAIEGKTIVPDKEKITPFTHQTENLKGGRFPTCNLFIRKSLCNFHPQYTSNFREDSDLAFWLLSHGHQIPFKENLIVYHPVLSGTWKTPYKLALRYEFDCLLKKRFPSLYRNTLDVHSIGVIKIPNVKKKVCFLFIVFSLLSALYPSPATVFLMIILLAMVYFIHLRSTSIKACSPKDLFLSLFLIPTIPFVLYFALIKGQCRFTRTQVVAK